MLALPGPGSIWVRGWGGGRGGLESKCAAPLGFRLAVQHYTSQAPSLPLPRRLAVIDWQLQHASPTTLSAVGACL